MKRALFAVGLLVCRAGRLRRPRRGAGPHLPRPQRRACRARTLHLPGAQKPYYLNAVVGEDDAFYVTSSFGALLNKGTTHRTVLSVKTRVGSPAFDNTNFTDPTEFSFRMFMGGEGQAGPIEPDYDALRHELWLMFDSSYKQSVEALSKKHAFLETNQLKGRPEDFSLAPVKSEDEPRQPLRVDQSRWTALVKRASAVFRDHPTRTPGW